VKEIRDRQWPRAENEKSDRNRKKGPKNYERRGEGKGFRDNQDGENANNQGFNRRSKPKQWQQRERKKATNAINDAAANQSRD